MNGEDVYRQLCNLQSYSHSYLCAKGTDHDHADVPVLIDNAMHCMSIAWAVADQLEELGAGAGPVHDAFTRLADRWSRSVDAAVKLLPARDQAKYRRPVAELRAARALPVAPVPAPAPKPTYTRGRAAATAPPFAAHGGTE